MKSYFYIEPINDGTHYLCYDTWKEQYYLGNKGNKQRDMNEIRFNTKEEAEYFIENYLRPKEVYQIGKMTYFEED